MAPNFFPIAAPLNKLAAAVTTSVSILWLTFFLIEQQLIAFLSQRVPSFSAAARPTSMSKYPEVQFSQAYLLFRIVGQNRALHGPSTY